MDILNRKADVDRLKCIVCQDFLRMIVVPNWQPLIMQHCANEINKKTYADKYREAYSKMRDKGSAYSVEDMDVTFICTIVNYAQQIIKYRISPNTRSYLKLIQEDRNETQGHTSFNEEQEELYLNCLLSLCKLGSFVKTVDKYDTDIDSNIRLSFRKKSLAAIDELKDTIDKERIDSIYKHKKVDADVQQILDDYAEIDRRGMLNKPYHKGRVFDKKFRLYMDGFKTDEGYELFGEFVVKASEAGITDADSHAAHYLLSTEDRYCEGLHLLLKLYRQGERIDYSSALEVERTINYHLKKEKALTNDMNEIIKLIKEAGYIVEKNPENGLLKVSSPK